MKSPMVEKLFPEDANNYGELQVLRSNSGYYVGTIYSGDGFDEPGSRDTGYYRTRADAENALKLIEAGEIKTRMEP